MKPQKALSLEEMWNSAGLGSSFTPTCQTSFNIKQVGALPEVQRSLLGKVSFPYPDCRIGGGVPSQAEAGWGPHI